MNTQEFTYIHECDSMAQELSQVALQRNTVYIVCQKSVNTMKNQVRPIFRPKDGIWSPMDKLKTLSIPSEGGKEKRRCFDLEMIWQVKCSTVSMQ